MILRPPRSTRTDTLFPYTTLFRSTDESGSAASCRGLGTPHFNCDATSLACYPPRPCKDYAFKAGRGLVFQIHESQVLCLPFRSEDHTSELQSLMRISYAVFCLKKKNKKTKIKSRIQAYINKQHRHNTVT